MTPAALSIASAFGVPGTAGTMVADADGGLFLLSNHHVVFGGGAKGGDCVWGLPEDGQPPALLGWGRRGQIGRVSFGQDTPFVDCALIELAGLPSFPRWLQRAVSRSWPLEVAEGAPGMRVLKHGAISGATEGVLVDVAHADFPSIEGRDWIASGQLLVDSLDTGLNFSAPGDSGAMLLDTQGRMLGLLWGSNAAGQGIACPIRPVLSCLAVAPVDRIGGRRAP